MKYFLFEYHYQDNKLVLDRIHYQDLSSLRERTKMYFDLLFQIETGGKYYKETVLSDNITYSSEIIVTMDSKLLDYLSKNPNYLYCLSSELFEDVMAELYRRCGYDVQKTQSTRDGGKDLILTDHTVLGDFHYYAECKKYHPDYHVGVDIIRQMSGILLSERVTGGIIATTSFFTEPAQTFIKSNNLQNIIKLHDYNYIRSLLCKQVS